MPMAATRGDALRVIVSGAEQRMMTAVGTVPGVAVLAVAALNGPGTARLRVTADGAGLCWKAPGLPAFGPPTPVPADGDYLVEDGTDPARWARVRVRRAWLPGGAAEATVLLGDRYGTAVAGDDVTVTEAAIGTVEAYTATLRNDGPIDLLDLRVWIEPDGDDGIEISDDGAVWVAPDGETHDDVLHWPRIVSGQSATLHLRRTTAAGAASDPDVLRVIGASWDGA